MNPSSSPPDSNVQSSHIQPRSRFHPLFFNPTAKLAALRISLLASAALLGAVGTVADWHKTGDVVIMVTLAVVFLHHLGSAFKIRFMVRLLDLILLIVEIVLLAIFARVFLPSRFDRTSIIVIFVTSLSLVISLLFLLLCRIAAIVRYKGGTFFKTFNLLEDAERIKGIPIQNCPAAYSMLLGRSIWRKQFVGESLTIRLMRGFMAGVFITALIGYGVLSFVVKPIQETALTPIKESRAEGIPGDLDGFEANSWDFVFKLVALSKSLNNGLNGTGLAPEDLYGQVVKVTPLQNSRPALGPDGDLPSCTNFSDATALLKYGDFLHVNCPFRVFRGVPDVLIEVNYEPLLSVIQANTLSPNIGLNTITATIGFSNKTATHDGIFSNPKSRSKDILFLPNSHSLGEVSYELRKILKRPALSALGMFEDTDVFALPLLQNIVPDPLALANPPVFNMTSTSSTFRLFFTFNLFEIRVIEDSRQQSVLGGFAAVGGLWTFLGGVFAVLFGTNLMRIFFYAKPLSIFGLAQQFEKTEIVNAHLEEYPNIRQEIDLPKSQRGLMSLLQDCILDVDFFREAVRSEGEGSRKDSEPEKPAFISRPSDLETGSSSAHTPGVDGEAGSTLTYRK